MNYPENSDSFDVLIGSKRRNTDSSQDETVVISPSLYSGYQIPPPPDSQQSLQMRTSTKTSQANYGNNVSIIKPPPPRVISRKIRRGKKHGDRRNKSSLTEFTNEDEALISNLIDGVKAEPPTFRKSITKRRRRGNSRHYQTPHQSNRMDSNPPNSGPYASTVHSQGSSSSSISGSSLTSSTTRKRVIRQRQSSSTLSKGNVNSNSFGESNTSNPLKRKRMNEENMEQFQQLQPPTKKLRITSSIDDNNNNSHNNNNLPKPQPPPKRFFPFTARNRVNLLESAKKYIVVNSKVYWKLGIVGRGGSSKVFKCICEDSNEIVAIKRVRLVGPPHIISSFLNEVEILKNLQGSKHIIRLYDSEVKKASSEQKTTNKSNRNMSKSTDDEEEELLYLVMECGEVDLNNVLRSQRNQPLNLNLVRLYWEQMLDAVSAIHEKRIVHGDLKPANFLLVRGAIKLIDFGIAKTIQHDNTTNIVREAQVGTLNYISPEALQVHHEDYDEEEDDFDDGDQPNQKKKTRKEGEGRSPRYKVGRSSDIWSLGCILSQMVTGHAPFAHYAMFQKIQAIVDDDVKIVVPKHVPRDVASIVKMTLRRNPKKRPTIPQLLNHSFLKPNKSNTNNEENSNNFGVLDNNSSMISRRDCALLLNRNSQVLFSSKYSRKEKEFFCSEMIRKVQNENLSCMEIMDIKMPKKKKKMPPPARDHIQVMNFSSSASNNNNMGDLQQKQKPNNFMYRNRMEDE